MKTKQNFSTKPLMVSSAVIMGLIGISLIFLPEEILNIFGSSTSEPLPLILQILGALYFAFATLNWTAKSHLIGGIYSRPVSSANFTHFIIGALMLIRFTFSNQPSIMMGIITLIYVVFAILFGYILFRHPGLRAKD